MSNLGYDDDNDNLNQGQATVPLSSLQAMQDKLLYLMDRYTLNLIAQDPDLNLSMIRHTHLNRTTNITRHEAYVKILETKRDYEILGTQTNEEDFNSGTWFKINSVIRNEELAIHDSIDGWKLKQLQLKERKLTIDEQPQKKPGLFSRFG